MELFAPMPEWWVWLAVLAVGVLGLATIANVLQAARDLDAN